MKKTRWIIILLAVVLLCAAAIFYQSLQSVIRGTAGDSAASDGYSGTQSCRECHEEFYQLWATSYHGLAMQPFTAELFRTRLTPQTEDLVVGDSTCRVEFDGTRAWISESGPRGKKEYLWRTPSEKERLLFPHVNGSRASAGSSPGV